MIACQTPVPESNLVIHDGLESHPLPSPSAAAAPIFKLLPEIIGEIFLICRDDAITQLLSCGQTSSFSIWIQATSLVCNYWRRIAVGFPALWTWIPFHCPPLVETMLKRSKNSDLVFIIHLVTDSVSDSAFFTLRLAFEKYLSRAQEILFHRISDEQVKALFKSLPIISVPRLQLLSDLRFFDGISIDIISLLVGTIKDTCALRNLFVSNAITSATPWNSPLLTNLTYLRLRNPSSSHRDQPPPQAHFLQALRCTPSLQHLHLIGFAFPRSPTSSTLVHLPKLQTLRLGHISPDFANILNHIRFHPTVQIWLHCHTNAKDVPSFAGMLSPLGELYSSRDGRQRPPLIGGLSLRFFPTSVDGGQGSGFELIAWPPALAEESPDRSFREISLLECNYRFRISMGWGETEMPSSGIRPKLFRAMKNICNEMSFQKLQVLLVECIGISIPELDASTILDVFGAQPELHSIYVNGMAILPVISGLTPKPAEHMKYSEQENTFPALRYLYILHGSLWEGRLTFIKNLLKKRSELGCGLYYSSTHPSIHPF